MYAIAVVGALAFAGTGTTGIGLLNPAHASDVLSVLGHSVFGNGVLGNIFYRLLLIMVLSSAAASTQTTILPTARTTLSMSVYGGLPKSFSRMHRRYLTPTVSTLVMGGVSFVLYACTNFLSHGNVIPDCVSACGMWIAFYYGLSAFACAWYYRKALLNSARDFFMRGVIPLFGGLIMYFLGAWSLWSDYDVHTGTSYTTFTVPGLHWEVGGVFVIVFLSALVGVILYSILRIVTPDYFRGRTLTRATPTLVPEEY